MSADQVFSMANLLASAGWVGLIVLGRLRRVATLVTALVIPGALATLYFALIVGHLGEAHGGGFGSLTAVATLFANRWLLLAGWLHYLAFDLLVGSWEVRDAQAHGIPHWMVVPCLVLTFLLGPIGWLTYRALRGLKVAKGAVAM